MFLWDYLERYEDTEPYDEKDDGLSVYEKTVLLLAVSLLLFFCAVGAWSWVLLVLEDIEGGGPLGLLMRILPLHLLL